MAEDCIFCKIAEGEIPSEIVYEDKDIVAACPLGSRVFGRASEEL